MRIVCLGINDDLMIKNAGKLLNLISFQTKISSNREKGTFNLSPYLVRLWLKGYEISYLE